jgi:hypothetical protein
MRGAKTERSITHLYNEIDVQITLSMDEGRAATAQTPRCCGSSRKREEKSWCRAIDLTTLARRRIATIPPSLMAPRRS